ncbi:MAG: tRNA (5-methylaminomethyl-2-thiouridine)(34)-methyltransferase MnmD [Prochlorococcus sp.]
MLRPSLTQTSGTTLSGCTSELGPQQHPLGTLSSYATADGSYSLYSSHFKEAFHSSAGALAEARSKFVAPAQLERFYGSKQLRVLDVCVGLGYNSAALIEALQGSSIRLQWWGLELDPRPLNLALQQPNFKANWSLQVLKILEDIRDSSSWQQKSSQGTLLWGDARQKLNLLPNNLKIDLILLDAFSPSRCPKLWSEEFLTALARKLAPGGRLLTYCRAAAVRASLRRAGLQLRSLLRVAGEKQGWSAGTLAISPEPNEALSLQGPSWQALTLMEEEHLLTRAAIPYRDPSGQATVEEILERRKQEQQHCAMESTNSWQRRWSRDLTGECH